MDATSLGSVNRVNAHHYAGIIVLGTILETVKSVPKCFVIV